MSEPKQGAFPMDELCLHLAGLTQAVKGLREGYSQLEERVQALSPPATTLGSPHASSSIPAPPVLVMLPSETRVPTPERFSGERSKFRAFRNSCELYFALQPRTFSLDIAKMGFVIFLLQNEPQTWAHHLLEQRAVELTNLITFIDAMAQIYEDPQLSATAESALCAF
ncbi:protein LDOC1-like [Aquarana catesbeiana]|uniref:protein LDOC1-like n=1 Tax=Aquarana catesbeiana TaxID=8400 RepID=UPI003CC9AB9A